MYMCLYENLTLFLIHTVVGLDFNFAIQTNLQQNAIISI